MGGGDGMGGLALMIFLASLCILGVPALACGGLGFLVLRKRKWGRWIAAGLGATLGAVGGGLGVTATFYESTWSPPDEIEFVVPSGFSHEWVYLIDDPSSSVEVEWTGNNTVPFMGRTARLSVPASGVLRVRDLAALHGWEVEARLSDGRTKWGFSGFRVPSAIAPPGGARVGLAFCFAQYGDATEPDPGMMNAEDLAARIEALEAAR